MDKRNLSKIIVAGFIAAFWAVMMAAFCLPVTYAEKVSPDGKYKLIAQYSLREGIICSLSMAGSGR